MTDIIDRLIREAVTCDEQAATARSENYMADADAIERCATTIREAADQLEQAPLVAVEAVLRAIDNFEDHRRGAAGYTGPLAERVVATCRELERRVLAGWEPQRALADYLIAEFSPGMVDPAVVLPEAGVVIGAPAEVALRALKYAKARGAFRVAGETFPLASNLREAAAANPALADLLSRAADAIEVAMQHADEAEAITMAKTVEIVKTIEMKGAQLEALRAANASLATDAGLWAREPRVEWDPNDDGTTEIIAPPASGDIDQREADIALSNEVEQQTLARMVVDAGALLHPGRTDLTEIAGLALISEFRYLADQELVHEDLEEAGLPEMIEDLEARLMVDDIDEDDGE